MRPASKDSLLAHDGRPPGDDAGHRELSRPAVVGHHAAQLALPGAGVEGGGAGPVASPRQSGTAVGRVIGVLSQGPGQLAALVPGRCRLCVLGPGTAGRLAQPAGRHAAVALLPGLGALAGQGPLGQDVGQRTVSGGRGGLSHG